MNGDKDLRFSHRSLASSSSSGWWVRASVRVHRDLKFVRRKGKSRQPSVEMWAAVIGGGAGRYYRTSTKWRLRRWRCQRVNMWIEYWSNSRTCGAPQYGAGAEMCVHYTMQ